MSRAGWSSPAPRSSERSPLLGSRLPGLWSPCSSSAASARIWHGCVEEQREDTYETARVRRERRERYTWREGASRKPLRLKDLDSRDATWPPSKLRSLAAGSGAWQPGRSLVPLLQQPQPRTLAVRNKGPTTTSSL